MDHPRIQSNSMKLSVKAEKMVETILKHYPMCESEKENQATKGPTATQHLHDFRKERQIYEKPIKQKLENMQFFKQQGNNHYKNQRYRQAAYCYQKIIVYGDYTFPDLQEDIATMQKLIQQANCNLAISLIKLDEWQKVKVYLNEASKGPCPTVKAKAIYWLVKYQIKHNLYQETKQTLSNLKQQEGQQSTSATLEEELLRSIKENEKKTEKVFSGIFCK